MYCKMASTLIPTFFSCTACSCNAHGIHTPRLSKHCASPLSSVSISDSSSISTDASPSLGRNLRPLHHAQSSRSPPDGNNVAANSRPQFALKAVQGPQGASLEAEPGSQCRRQLIGVSIACIPLLCLHDAGSAFADDAEDKKGREETPSSTLASSGLVQRLLERSKANKAKNDAERLNDYYKRNYKDYFNFIKGSIVQKDKDKLTEAEKGILEWLEKNE